MTSAFIDQNKARGFDDFATEEGGIGNRQRVKGTEMNEATYSASLQKAATEEKGVKLRLHTERRSIDSMLNLSQKREGKPLLSPPERVEQKEIELEVEKRVCSRCGINPVYLNIKTLDWCEPCIYEVSQE